MSAARLDRHCRGWAAEGRGPCGNGAGSLQQVAVQHGLRYPTAKNQK